MTLLETHVGRNHPREGAEDKPVGASVGHGSVGTAVALVPAVRTDTYSCRGTP